MNNTWNIKNLTSGVICVSLELAKISGIRVTFGVMINDNRMEKLETVSLKNYQGKEYLSIKPYPYIKIEMVNRKDRDGCITLNKMNIFYFIKRMSTLIKAFKSKEYRLFFMNENKLIIDAAKQRQVSIPFSTGNGGSCIIQPAVVTDEKNNNVYEGVNIIFNNGMYITSVTYEEFEYLMYLLNKIDLDMLSLNAIQIAMYVNDNKTINNISKENESILLKNKRITPEVKNTMPEI